MDDLGRPSVASWAFRVPQDAADSAAWPADAFGDMQPGKIYAFAACWDQGQDVLTLLRATKRKNEQIDESQFNIPFGGLPLGPKDLPLRHSKRIRKWLETSPDESVGKGAALLQAPNRQPDAWGRLLRWLARQHLVFHNAKFDLHHLAAGLRGCEGNDPEQGGGLNLVDSTIFDTQLTQFVLTPRDGSGLKPTSVRLGLGKELGLDEGTEDAEQQALKPWKGPKTDPRFDLIPWRVIRPYAEMDAALTLLLYEYQIDLLDDVAFQHELKHVRREFGLMKTLYAMERRGVGYAVDESRHQAEICRKLMEQVASQLPFKPTYPGAQKYFFGPELDDAGNPTGNLGHLPFNDKLTAGGKPQVDEEVIDRLVKEGVPNAEQFARYAELSSANSKWYQAWADLTGTDGRLRTSHKQTAVISGRLSVQRAQLQAIPHNYLIPDGLAPVRGLFRAKEGHQLWEIDVSQAEIRIATAVARCQPMLDQFLAGQDSHSAACWLMFRTKFEQDGITTIEQAQQHPQWDEFRQVAKRALVKTEPVATPTGWRPIGDLIEGDLVLGPDGQSRKVREIPYEGEGEVWEVRTKSGRVVRCDADHLWTVRNGRNRQSTHTTHELRDRMRSNARGGAFYLPASEPAQFDPVELPIDPYLLGVLLGDGSLVYNNPKWYGLTEDGDEVAARLAIRTPDTVYRAQTAHNGRASRYSLRGGHTQAALVGLGLAGRAKADKFVPSLYLRGSVEQRYELLRGLMDTDGCVTKGGQSNIFSSTSPQLVEAMAELVRSLGGVATVAPMHKSRHERHPNWADAWFVRVRTPECPFALSRKVERWKPPTMLDDRIVEVRPTGEHAAMRCITVDAEDGLFLTRDYVPTHNCNLGILYGAGAGTVREQILKFTGIDYPLSQVRQWVNDWRAAFPPFVQMLDAAARKAAQDGWVRLINGRVRWFSDYEPTHKAANQVIQGSQAEVIKDCLVRVDREFPGMVLLCVHDSIVCEFPIMGDRIGTTRYLSAQAMAERVSDILVEEFERAFTRPWKSHGGQPVTVPFKADIKPWKS